MAAKVFYDKDADLKYLKGKTVAIMGFGSQGHAHAQNLKDSGIGVVVGARAGSRAEKAAKKAGLQVKSVADAAKAGQFIMMLVPDHIQGPLYNSDIKQHVEKGDALFFAHGFSIHFGQIVAPDSVDVVMVAPKGPGHLVRHNRPGLQQRSS